jgi:hypothetical protein
MSRQANRKNIPTEVIYPDSDGKPMADNTKQFDWIVTFKENLDYLVPDFVAGDLLWYPVQGNPKVRQAPDIMVAFGRPKGHRGSYMQWKEDGIAPQVVFEIMSPGNTRLEMERKLAFYDRYGVEEYYIYDPDDETLVGYLRENNRLGLIREIYGWVSPLLNIRFEPNPLGLRVFYPDGREFLAWQVVARRADLAIRQVEQERQRADLASRQVEQERQQTEIEKQRAETEKQRAETEKQRAEKLAEKLRALGIDPNSI